MGRWRLALPVMAGLAAAACSVESGPNISGVPAIDIRWVEISPSTDTLLIPDTVRVTDRLQLRAVAFGLGSKTLDVNRFVWSSLDTTIAKVDSFGLVTPRRIGTVEITASATRVGHATVVILPAANRVIVSPGSDSIFVDDPAINLADTVRFVARTLDAAGIVVAGVRYSWQSSAPTVATVDSAGLVRAISIGTSAITVRTGTTQTTATITVLPVVRNVAVTSSVTQVLDGDTVQLVGRAFDYLGRPVLRTFTWRSLNPTVALVDSTGRVIFIAPGSASFTATTAFRSNTVSIPALPRQLVSVDAGVDFACGTWTDLLLGQRRHRSSGFGCGLQLFR